MATPGIVSVKCRTLNKRDRLEQAREAFEQSKAQQLEGKEHFHQCLERCEQARRDANDMRISGSQYRTELDTIEAYYAKYKYSTDQRFMNQRLWDRIQDIFRSVR